METSIFLRLPLRTMLKKVYGIDRDAVYRRAQDYATDVLERTDDHIEKFEQVRNRRKWADLTGRDTKTNALLALHRHAEDRIDYVLHQYIPDIIIRDIEHAEADIPLCVRDETSGEDTPLHFSIVFDKDTHSFALFGVPCKLSYMLAVVAHRNGHEPIPDIDALFGVISEEVYRDLLEETTRINKQSLNMMHELQAWDKVHRDGYFIMNEATIHSHMCNELKQVHDFNDDHVRRVLYE